MYLKALEIVGFKSFADRTRLEFTPGMSAIVGPNGCGKSNVSDAIRWVLGEQSAKLLRGSKMEDCIFNGTEKRKPLGMAEVSLFLTDCEQALGTEFNEVTVTRRVFRSGEGQYFINKTPCRLRDIQRLFMDTGVGTSSYSLMEQGRIDLILSSRPEDRREVFEEASGITKYKTDKREALRKLEQTEANLLRLADIIKEVRRQIISLQRQAGKAARYKKHQEELRRLDIYAAREKLKNLDETRMRQEQLLESIRHDIATHQESIRQHEQVTEAMRERMAEAEHEVGAEQQILMELTGKRDRARQAVEIGRRRIEELETQSARDNADATGAGAELEAVSRELEETQRQLAEAEGEYEAAQAALRAHTAKLTEHEQRIAAAKQTVNRLLAESMDQENRLTHIQNELQRLENEDRHITSRRERCAAEQENLKLLLTGHEKRAAELTTARAESQAAKTQAAEMLEARQEALAGQHEHIRQTEKNLSELRSARAAAAARMEMIERNIKAQSGFSKTARQLLEPAAGAALPEYVLGALAARIEAAPEYRVALETALRAWLDAVVVTDMSAALECLRQLEPAAQDALRLLAAQAPAAVPAAAEGAPPPGAERLRPHVTAPAAFTALLDRMLHGVWVLDDLATLPQELHPAAIYVTRSGLLIYGDGRVEIHRGGAREASPLAHKHLLAEQREQLDAMEAQIADAQTRLEEHMERRRIIEQELQAARADLTEKQQVLARQEGEFHLVEKQAAGVRQNLETVNWEMRELEKQGGSAADKSALIEEGDKIRERRLEIRRQIEAGQQSQTSLEEAHKQLAAEAAAAQVQFGKREVARAHMQSRRQPLAERMRQLQKTIEERRARGATHAAEIAEVNQRMQQAQTDLPQLDSEIERLTARLAEIQTLREQMQATAKTADGELHGLRAEIEALTRRESETNGKCVEQRMQRQYLIERITGEYRISADAIQVEPEPEWSDGQRPDLDAIDIAVAELRAKLDSMGAVNTDAIAEYKEQEERYEFLNHQQDDLLKSKQQLLEMIKQINQTTTEMFAGTFAAINENFQSVFKQLFGGGSAKLMLTDEEDVLECGIEIIARPPGKKLQSVSLMSGGERTMTAVALLFAIFMVKPSPFCVLDELDAALDESNINRFIKVLRGFIAKSQFIVITHNRATISAAGVLYGVTMAETGVSKIVSMRFVEEQPVPARESEKAEAQPASADAETPSDEDASHPTGAGGEAGAPPS